MVFSSSVFLFLFLPIIWILYTLIPVRYISTKNTLLGVASILFYAFGEPIYLLLMLGSIIFNYFAAVWIAKTGDRTGTVVCVFSVFVNLALLCLFKYSPWLTDTFNKALRCSLSVPVFTIPVGISFYTFQILSYVVDVKNRKTPVQKNILNLLLYISFFPQLIAGPIVKYSDIQEQIGFRAVTAQKTAHGLRRFIYGLTKKLIVSNTAAVIADAAFGSTEMSSCFAWAGAMCYCIQLYFDFSGYSDMAIGLAEIFGFSICENFNYPYSAVSIRDFWKRWHISLTTWFREYVYFPLGGNRCGSVRTVVNRIFVFFLTGLWHGANFTFIVWGLWHGLLMMFEQFVHFDRIAQKRVLRPVTRIYTLLCVCLGFVVFRAPSLSEAIHFIGTMFSFGSSGADALIYFSPFVCLILACGVIFSCPVLPWLRRKASENEKSAKIFDVIEYLIALPAFLLCIMQISSSTFNPFIYYNF